MMDLEAIRARNAEACDRSWARRQINKHLTDAVASLILAAAEIERLIGEIKDEK